MSIEVSVVVPTYNRANLLERCLTALFGQTADPNIYEIIVVDDGSTDETSSIITHLSNTAPCGFNYIRQTNLGRSKTRNNGIMAAKGRLIILLDGDMVVRSEFVAAHLKAHTKPKLIVHGPVVNTTNIDNPSTWPTKVYDFSRAFFATGNVSIERTEIIAVGLFDEDFIEYGWEDLELGERLRKRGFKSVKAPSACSFHLQYPLTYPQLPQMLQKEKERGHTAVLFLQKNPSFNVRLMTLISPFFFLFDRLLTLFHWPERSQTFKLLKYLDSKRWLRFLFLFLVIIIKNHAYADGLREALKK